MNDVKEIIETVAASRELIVFGALAICGSVGIVFGSLVSIVKSVSKQRTRREIAAYIAEGSMTPEQGERLLEAGRRRST